jgi:hypothetical protein
VDVRHGDPHVARAPLAHAQAHRGLVPVVELLLDAGDQLPGQAAQAHGARRLHAALELTGGQAQHGGVALDDLAHAGALDLHDHAGAVQQHRPVRLPD